MVIMMINIKGLTFQSTYLQLGFRMQGQSLLLIRNFGLLQTVSLKISSSPFSIACISLLSSNCLGVENAFWGSDEGLQSPDDETESLSAALEAGEASNFLQLQSSNSL